MSSRSWLVAAAALVLLGGPPLAPAVAEGAWDSVQDRVLDLLLERGNGVLPATATVDGGHGPRVVSFEESMAWLRANPGAFPGPQGASGTDDVVTPTTDLGFAVRSGSNPCHVAIIVYALSFEPEGQVLDVDEPLVAVPDDDIPCAGGTRSWIGEASASLAPASAGWWAVLTYETPVSAAWVHEPTNTHVDDFDRVALHGRVAYHQVRWCDPFGCLTLGQLIAGTVNAPGQVDVATISLS